MKKIPSLRILRIFFLLYCLFILWLLFGRSFSWTEGYSYRQQLQENTNLIPLFTIKNYLYAAVHSKNPLLVKHCIINLTGNIFLFLPLGIMIPRLWPRQRNFLCFLLTCSGLVIGVEAVQLLTLLGSFDVDDFILNMLGLTAGFLIYYGSSCRKIPNKE